MVRFLFSITSYGGAEEGEEGGGHGFASCKRASRSAASCVGVAPETASCPAVSIRSAPTASFTAASCSSSASSRASRSSLSAVLQLASLPRGHPWLCASSAGPWGCSEAAPTRSSRQHRGLRSPTPPAQGVWGGGRRCRGGAGRPGGRPLATRLGCARALSVPVRSPPTLLKTAGWC